MRHSGLIALLASLLLLLVSACGEDGTGPDGGEPESLRLEIPEFASVGQAFQLKVTVHGNDPSTPLGGFSGTVELTVSSGTISPQSVQLSGGTGQVQATVTGSMGEVTVRATLTALESSAALQVLGPDQLLKGDPDDPASTAIPDMRFEPRPEDYSDDHPELPGFYLSHNTLLFEFTAGTTVAEANQVLGRLNADIVGGIPGPPAVPGLLFLRLPSATHAEMESVLVGLDQDPHVQVATPDALLGADLTTRTDGVEAGWKWDLEPTGGNWGLELTRVPQLWNLKAAIEESGNAEFGIGTGVLDVGFAKSPHDDLTLQNLTPEFEDWHGMHVAGIIGAKFDNNEGIDGINPFAHLTARGYALNAVPPDAFHLMQSVGEAIVNGFLDLVSGRSLKVVNISLGYAWHTFGIDTNTNARAKRLANDQGEVFRDLLANLQALPSSNGRLPVVVVSAGNSSGQTFGDQQARYNSPMTNAALEHGAKNIIVVENIDYVGQPVRWPTSNVGGHLSAPGTDILSLDLAGYKTSGGTSQAAPHVTGVIGYLYALDHTLEMPTLSENKVLDLLKTHAKSALQAAPHVDAFAAALALDGANGNDLVLRMLLDIDDSTPDGNQRLEPDGTTPSTTDSEGDGKIDMRDFRRWRDALLQVEDPPELSLDGASDHPKRDLNGDGDAGVDSDSIFPRADFNGDGRLHRTETVDVPGFSQPVTDLEVLQKEGVFDDPNYDASHLDELIESADVAVHPKQLSEREGVLQIRSTIRPADADEPEADDARFRRYHSGEEADGNGLWQVYTVPAYEEDGTTQRTWTARVIGLDAAGDTLFDTERDFTTKPGKDHFWNPGCRIHPGGLALASQADVEAASDICEVVGTLSIIEDGPDPITTLQPLASLERVGHLAMVGTTQLVDLAGLERLVFAERAQITIGNNIALTTLDGLATNAERQDRFGRIEIANNPALTSIAAIGNAIDAADAVIVEGLTVSHNPLLTSLTGLEAIRSAPSVFLRGNHLLTTVDALAGLTSVSGTLNVQENGLITLTLSLDVLGHLVAASNEQLSQIAISTGQLEHGAFIDENPKLADVSITAAIGAPSMSIKGEALKTVKISLGSGTARSIHVLGPVNTLAVNGVVVSDAITISETQLAAIPGFGLITKLEQRLRIYGNPNLTDISNFSSLESIDSLSGSLTIAQNPQLCVPAWVDDVTVRQKLVSGNKSGCD